MSQYRTASLDTSDLLRCAHCNGEPEYRDGSSTRPYIRCKSCGMRTGSSYDYDHYGCEPKDMTILEWLQQEVVE